MPKNEYICDCNILNESLVENVMAKMPPENTFLGLADFYKILGDPTRCKMLYVLKEHEMCVCDLANVLSMTKSSVSHQLGKMRECGAVKCRREGKAIYYSLDDEHILGVLDVSLKHIRHKQKEKK